MPRRLALAALLVLLALVASWPATRGSFVYDDLPYVQQNPVVHGDAPLLSTPLGSADQGLWRPFTVWTWRLQWAPPYTAGPFLLVNVLLHGLATLLLWLLGRRLGLSSVASALAAALFAVHPVHAEAIAWVTGRAELLGTVFVLAGWILHRRGGGPAALVGALVCVALGGLSKENALIAPGLYLLADLALPRRRPGGQVSPIPWARLALLAATSAAVFAARLGALEQALPGHGPFHDSSLASRLVVALAVLARSLQLLAWPADLRIHYQGDEFLQLDALGLALPALLLTAVLLLWRRQRRIAVALALIPASLFPVLHLLPIGEPFAERFLYLPSAPFCLAVGAALAAWSRVELAGRGLGASLAASVLLLVLAIPASRDAVAVFADDLSLWAHARQRAPDLAAVPYNHATFLQDAGRHLTLDRDLPGAADELRASLALAPSHPQAAWAHQTLGHYALGALGSGRPDPAAAARHYRRALALQPGLVDARINLAGLALSAPELIDAGEALTVLQPLLDADQLDTSRLLAAQQLAHELAALLPR